MFRAALVVATAVLLLSPAAGADPPTPPPNDNRASATVIHPPTVVGGTTVGATTEQSDPYASCGGQVQSTVWYRIADAPGGRIVLRLHADGDLDGVLAVFESRRSQLLPVACAPSDRRGRAQFVFAGKEGANYFILFGRLHNSVDGTFTLRAATPGPTSRPPGTHLPGRGAHSFLDPLERPDKAWSTRMQAGTTYKINLAPERGQCIAYGLFPPGTSSFDEGGAVLRRACGGYATFTPGPRQSGRYGIFVQTRGTRSGRQHYRLQVAPAGPDDIGPGLPLTNQQTRRGALNAGRVDVVTFFHFEVALSSDVTLRMRDSGRFELLLLSETGRRIDCECGGSSRAYIRRGLKPGQYYAVVRALTGSRGSYRVSLLVRAITQTQTLVAGSRSAILSPGQTADVEARVTPAAAGHVSIYIERFLPLDGWVFSRRVNLQTGGDGTARLFWRPPALGRWRIRTFFRGTQTASPSSSGYLILTARG
ncbi:MAG TPA: hypothetical protein VKC65_02600 [Gaiellaceae bacterium]|nr:hypothetical protein [Gaiellaceae bacterium]